jgi:hypothetical protein
MILNIRKAKEVKNKVIKEIALSGMKDKLDDSSFEESDIQNQKILTKSAGEKKEDSIRLLCMSDIAQTLHNPQCREDVFNVLIKWTDKLCKK